jgi:hypothetical protein
LGILINSSTVMLWKLLLCYVASNCCKLKRLAMLGAPTSQNINIVVVALLMINCCLLMAGVLACERHPTLGRCYWLIP